MLLSPGVGTWLIIAAVGLFVAWQVPFLLTGAYSRRLVWEDNSPDQQRRLEIRIRVNCPAFDWLGSAGTAYFTVVDRASGGTIGSAEFAMREVQHFQPPTVAWSGSEVAVSGFFAPQPEAMVRIRFAPPESPSS